MLSIAAMMGGANSGFFRTACEKHEKTDFQISTFYVRRIFRAANIVYAAFGALLFSGCSAASMHLPHCP